MNAPVLLAAASLVALTSPGMLRAADPDFGPNVLIFDPAQQSAQQCIAAVFKQQERDRFGTGRYALLFMPGRYELDVPVGFYTHVVGLGELPGGVTIRGGVWTDAAWMGHDATCNFWRTVENLTVEPPNGINIWAVSQAAPLRRTHIKGDLQLSAGGWSSGGFMADCQVDGTVKAGSQQQWFSRNSSWKQWSGINWNMTFTGCVNPPIGKWPDKGLTVVEQISVMREKPYLFVDDGGRWFVKVPPLRREGTSGTTWGKGAAPGEALPIASFHLAKPGQDTAVSINAALCAGKNLLFTPGIYHLEDSIRISRPGTVVLGLGLPTLVPGRSTPVMVIADVDGVTVGGIMFDAGITNVPTLLQVGESGSKASHAKFPICLYDIFCRVGGATAGTADCMVTIHSRDVVGDNLWLWRADHGRGVGWDINKNKNGLIVNGDNVTMYGLFVEHTQEYQTIWNGNGGRVYFYQSEMPYDSPGQAAWQHEAVNGYASFKVSDAVTTHEAWGLGVYCTFRKAPVVADNAIETPTAPGIKMHHLVTIRLGGGQPGSGINHVINGQGDPVITTSKATID